MPIERPELCEGHQGSQKSGLFALWHSGGILLSRTSHGGIPMRGISRLQDLTFLQQTSLEMPRAPSITQQIQSRKSVLNELDTPIKETSDGHPIEHVE